MNKKLFLNIAKVIMCITICLSFCSCSTSSSTFVNAYEHKNTFEMIDLAVKDKLLESCGFTYDTNSMDNLYTYNKCKKNYGNVTLGYWQRDEFFTKNKSFGEIETQINEWTLCIHFNKEEMNFLLSGENENMFANVAYDFEPIDAKAPTEDGIHLNWILSRVDYEEIKSLCNKYEELTDEVMTEIYYNCKNE